MAGPDFGTECLAEHAVWAPQSHWFKVVISSRFADIFRGNCGKAGVVAAVVEQEVVDQILNSRREEPGPVDR